MRLSTLAFLLFSALWISCSVPDKAVETERGSSAVTGSVLQPNEGEVLILRRPGRSQVTIKVDPVNSGSRRVAMGTQLLDRGWGIPVHRHEHQDEILFVHKGMGTAILGEEKVPVEPGTTIYIPQGVWHGVDNTGAERSKIIWVVAPPGLEQFFRDIGAPPGTQMADLSPEEMEEISRKHGLTVKARR